MTYRRGSEITHRFTVLYPNEIRLEAGLGHGFEWDDHVDVAVNFVIDVIDEEPLRVLQ
jgi:hypothetical protein